MIKKLLTVMLLVVLFLSTAGLAVTDYASIAQKVSDYNSFSAPTDGTDNTAFDGVANRAPTIRFLPATQIDETGRTVYNFHPNDLIIILADGRDLDEDNLLFNDDGVKAKLPEGLQVKILNNGAQQNDLVIYGRVAEESTTDLKIAVSDGQVTKYYKLMIVVGYIEGCTNFGADNYDPNAEINDGSCTYPAESSDVDGDGIEDENDNCPTIANPRQRDFDNDGLGNVCDDDDDNDDVIDTEDCDPFDAEIGAKLIGYVDADLDGVAENDVAVDFCTALPEGYVATPGEDNCPETYNPRQRDADNDGIGNACEATVIDTDHDGIADEDDNCPTVANPNQEDADNDGTGDACEAICLDSDHDCIPDNEDVCAGQEDNLDNDNDNVPDGCDTDDDNDGILDTADNCDFRANPGQENWDGDALGNACDSTPGTNPNNNGNPDNTNLTYQQQYDLLEDKFNDYENDFDDLKDDYNDAVDDDDESDIKDAEDDLDDLDKDLKTLRSDVIDLLNEVEDNDEDNDDLIDDLEDLKSDIEDLRDDIDTFLNGEDTTDNTNDVDYYGGNTASQPSTTSGSSNSGTIVIETLPGLSNTPTGNVIVGKTATTTWDGIRNIVWIAAGIVILLAIILFLLAVLLSR